MTTDAMSVTDRGLPSLSRAVEALAACCEVHEAKRIADVASAASEWAKRAGLGRAAENHALTIKARAERRAGELLRQLERKSKSDPRRTKQTVASDGLSDSPYAAALADADMAGNAGECRARRWQKLADIPEADFEAAITAILADDDGKGTLTTRAIVRAATATSEAEGYDGDEWYTPASYVDLARRVLGAIDLDPASCEAAQTTVRAGRYHGAGDDGLAHPWSGRVFVNPPYSYPLVEKFVAKFVEEYEATRMTAGILLVNNCTDTAWFHSLLSRFVVCLTRGRVRFEAPGRPVFATRQGQAFFYAGPNVPLFGQAFETVGIVLGRLAP